MKNSLFYFTLRFAWSQAMNSKGALSLLSQYGDDSSEEEVPGPKVSTKRVYKEDSEEETTHKKLPVPAEFLKSSKTYEDHADDPILHNGRIRSFAHERGNWATFVYIPFEAQTGLADLLSFIESIIPNHFSLKRSDDFHISLTKTVILKHHWIKPFVESVKVSLAGFRKFFIFFDKVKIYCNEEKTRTFIGIQTKSGHDTLLSIVKNMDECLGEFSLPPFYKDPSFHMSIAWSVGDHQLSFESFLPQINDKLSKLMDIYSQENWYILANFIMCKTGNKFFRFELN